MVDVDRIKREASGRWTGIFHELGIDVPENNKHGACPICRAGKDRFRLFPDSVDGNWYCNQCDPHAGDGFSLIQKCLGIGFVDAVKKVSDLLGVIEMEFKPNKPKRDPSIYLNKIWGSSLELKDGDPVSQYLQSRGIGFLPADVRYCPECWESDTKQNYQAMVSRITSKAGKPIGLHVTYLKNGRKADIESPKKILTPTESLDGSAIQLVPPEKYNPDKIGIAEGVETALSAIKLFGIATWSCMTAGLMEKWIPPEGCQKVIVFADSDYSYAGQKSAYILANKLYLKGFKVEVKMPPDFMDFNDVLKSNLRK